MRDTSIPLAIALLTVSDTRTADTDRSGQYLAQALGEAGHRLAARVILPDDADAIAAQIRTWIAAPEVQVILSTGGTGFGPRDVTPEAVAPLLDRPIVGFGELFRQISHAEIGSSTIQSRALAGMAGGTLVFCIPGSTGACRTAWEGILVEQLDSRHRPCNFAQWLVEAGRTGK